MRTAGRASIIMKISRKGKVLLETAAAADVSHHSINIPLVSQFTQGKLPVGEQFDFVIENGEGSATGRDDFMSVVVVY